MAYRNATYVAFHAGGTTCPTDLESDIKYYNLMKAWSTNKSIEFSFINAHDKTSAVRDTSKRATLERSLKERLNNSKNVVLITTVITSMDTDWVPFEIQYAIDNCNLPIIAAYPDYRAVLAPDALSWLWPEALKARIDNQLAKVIHIPFSREPLLDAIDQFSAHNTSLDGGQYCYDATAHRNWGLLRAFESEHTNHQQV